MILVDFEEVFTYFGFNTKKPNAIYEYAPRMRDVIEAIGIRNLIEAIYTPPPSPGAYDSVWQMIDDEHPDGIEAFDDRELGITYLELFDVYVHDLITECNKVLERDGVEDGQYLFKAWAGEQSTVAGFLHTRNQPRSRF